MSAEFDKTPSFKFPHATYRGQVRRLSGTWRPDVQNP